MADTEERSVFDEEPMIVDVRGETWLIERAVLDDWELLEDLGSEGGAAAPSAARRMLGDEQYKKVKELIRDAKTGRVKASEMGAFLVELMEALKAGNR